MRREEKSKDQETEPLRELGAWAACRRSGDGKRNQVPGQLADSGYQTAVRKKEWLRSAGS